MSYHSHILNSTHSHIIGRTDPITGDLVKENDRVVFCAACKSCFLEESWVYMNEKHCEQNQTLETVPVLASKLTIKNRSEEMITELRNRGVNFTIVIPVMILTFLFSFIYLGLTSYGDVLGKIFFTSVFASFTSGVLTSVITMNRKFKRLVGNNRNDVRVFRNRIEIGKDSFSWNDIAQIKYQREISVFYGAEERVIDSDSSVLLIYFNEGKFSKHLLPTSTQKYINDFLIGLEKISHLTEVFYYSENIDDFTTIKNIQSNSNGNVQVGKPKKVVDAMGRPTHTSYIQ